MSIGTMNLPGAAEAGVQTPTKRIDRRLLAKRLIGVGVVGGLVAAGVLFLPDAFEADEVATEAAVRGTESVEVRDLALDVEVEGTVAYADPVTIVHRAGLGQTGVVTAVPELEATLGAGDELYRVNDEPVVLFIGDEPLNRTLEVGVDDGTDVQILEENLVALGYDPDETMTVDETFTDATAAVVEAWQEDLGVEVTGEVELGAVTVVPSEVRVAGISADVRTTVTDRSEVVQTTSVDRVVEFTVPAEEVATISAGDQVTVRLADRSEVAAVVDTVEPADGGAVLVSATATSGAITGQPGSTVDVLWATDTADGVASVLASAIFRVEGIGHAVEVVAADGTTTYVPVEVGIIDGQYAEVTSPDLDAGMTIVSP